MVSGSEPGLNPEGTYHCGNTLIELRIKFVYFGHLVVNKEVEQGKKSLKHSVTEWLNSTVAT